LPFSSSYLTVMIYPRTQESGEYDRDRHMAFCPIIRSVLGENAVSESSQTRYGSQRSPQGVSGYLHPPAPSTALDKKALNNLGYKQAKEKRGVERLVLRTFSSLQPSWLASSRAIHASHGRLMGRSRYFKVRQRKTALHAHLSKILPKICQSKKMQFVMRAGLAHPLTLSAEL
jgi:hypothetical protein